MILAGQRENLAIDRSLHADLTKMDSVMCFRAQILHDG